LLAFLPVKSYTKTGMGKTEKGAFPKEFEKATGIKVRLDLSVSAASDVVGHKRL
jgi:hypothetical protein